jgi:hypothetical protein
MWHLIYLVNDYISDCIIIVYISYIYTYSYNTNIVTTMYIIHKYILHQQLSRANLTI